MSRFATVLERWKPEWTTRAPFASLKGHLDKIEALTGDIQSQRARLTADGTLTSRGVAEQVRASAAKEVVPTLRRMHHAATKAAEFLAARRAKLTPPAPDKADVAGALLRQEIRAHLRGLSRGDRAALLLEGKDTRVLQAVVELPVLAGVDKELLDHVEKAAIEAEHGEELAAIEDDREAIAIVDAALKMATQVLKVEGGFENDQRGFDNFMSEASAPVDAELAKEDPRMDLRRLELRQLAEDLRRTTPAEQNVLFWEERLFVAPREAATGQAA